MLLGTPFHSRTAPLCQPQNWRNWSGYMVVGSYEMSPEREYAAIRNAAALIDVSPLMKYRLSGPDAARLLNRVVTRDVAKCAVGQVLYTPWCDAHGKVIDDGTVTRLDEQSFRLTAAEPNLRWLHLNATGLKVQIEDISESTAALALQGPLSRAILSEVSRARLDNLKYFRQSAARLGGVSALVSRTGYTGDLGYEIWMEAKDAPQVWDVLMKAGEGYGITPGGILALDLARIEAGLIMLDVDYTSTSHALIEDQKSSPYELSLGWTVNLDKEFFVGKQALAAEKKRGAAWQFTGLEVDWVSFERLHNRFGLPPRVPGAAWRQSTPVYVDGLAVGYASSGCWSPLLKQYIALAHLRSDYATPGRDVTLEITVEHQRHQAAAKVVKTPFFEPERKKA